MATTVLSRLHSHAQTRPNEPAYYAKVDGEWKPISWVVHCDRVHHAGRALMALGLGAGDTLGILGGNRPEWTTVALGCMAGGGVPTGIYTTSPPEDVRYLLNHAEPSVLLVEGGDEWEKIDRIRDELRSLRHVIFMQAADVPDDPLAMSWNAFLERRSGVSEEQLNERMHALEPDELAVLIYTAGTTGRSKGVMLSHANLVHAIRQFNEIVGAGPDDTYLSYLPLAHAAEQMFVVHGSTYVGNAVYYNTSLLRLAENLRDVQPTIFFGVPRVWEQFRDRIVQRLDEEAGVRRRLLDWAMNVAREATAVRNRGEEPTGWLAARYWLAGRLVYSRIKPQLGLAQARYCATGAAPIQQAVLDFFAGLGVTIYEGYSLSEGCGATTSNRPGRTKFGTVGPPLPEVEVRLADDGEILIRGPNVFKEYYKDPEATTETLIDGWLHSGDLGMFDEDGFLVLTGREKDIIVTSHGENVAPRKVEAALEDIELVDQAIVVGDGRRHLVALLTLDEDAATRYAREHEIDGETGLGTNPQILERIQKGIDAANDRLASFERVRAFRILPQKLSIERGELTPTLKVRRHVIEERYADLIEEMYT